MRAQVRVSAVAQHVRGGETCAGGMNWTGSAVCAHTSVFPVSKAAHARRSTGVPGVPAVGALVDASAVASMATRPTARRRPVRSCIEKNGSRCHVLLQMGALSDGRFSTDTVFRGWFGYKMRLKSE